MIRAGGGLGLGCLVVGLVFCVVFGLVFARMFLLLATENRQNKAAARIQVQQERGTQTLEWFRLLSCVSFRIRSRQKRRIMYLPEMPPKMGFSPL